jgi:hypothetical protein
VERCDRGFSKNVQHSSSPCVEHHSNNDAYCNALEALKQEQVVGGVVMFARSRKLTAWQAFVGHEDAQY